MRGPRRPGAVAVVLTAALAGCAGTAPQATEEPAPTSPAAQPTAAPGDAEVTWTVPDVADYEPTDASPDVRQLSSVTDSCLYQLAQDEAPAGVAAADVAELVDPVLRDLGAVRTGSSPATLASVDGPISATEVAFTAELDGLPAEGVMLVAAEHGLLLSVTYVCTDGPVPTDTWRELRAGTEARIRSTEPGP